MDSVRLTSRDYHALSIMALHEMEFFKDDPEKVCYLKALRYKLEEYMRSALSEENGDDEDAE